MITGTGVHDRPESAFTIDWNECSRSTGIGVHDPPERAVLSALFSLLNATSRNAISSGPANGLPPETDIHLGARRRCALSLTGLPLLFQHLSLVVADAAEHGAARSAKLASRKGLGLMPRDTFPYRIEPPL
jgi:hypothetical protein